MTARERSALIDARVVLVSDACFVAFSDGHAICDTHIVVYFDDICHLCPRESSVRVRVAVDSAFRALWDLLEPRQEEG